jgi:hypothetical protein
MKMIVNLNGHTNQLVDVTNWLTYPGEWPAAALEEIKDADLGALNSILECHQRGEDYLPQHVRAAVRYPWFSQMMGIPEPTTACLEED